MRPEGFKNPHLFMCTVDGKEMVDSWKRQRHLDYEAGADAYEEGLKKGGTLGDFDNCLSIDVKGLVSIPKGKSYLVFIPEDKE